MVTRPYLFLPLLFASLAISRPAAAQDGLIVDNLAQAVSSASVAPTVSVTSADTTERTTPDSSFHWTAALGQSFLFLVTQHAYRLKTEEKTREQLKGDFWRDYRTSVRGLRGWSDGGKVPTNYIFHPLQGSITGYIWAQNDPRTRRIQIGADRAYWISRLKAMAWTAAWSTQFEIGPISEASIGNVGMTPGTAGYVDIVVTPLMGTALMIAEDLSEKYLASWVNRHTGRFVQKAITPWLTPTRTVANAMRFHTPWYRDPPILTSPPEVR